MAAFCCLCGNQEEGELGYMTGICLDKAACHARKAAWMNAQALQSNPDIGVVTVGLEDLRAVLTAWSAQASDPVAFGRLAEAAGLVKP